MKKRQRNGPWISRALRWIRELGLNQEEFWNEYDQGEWKLEVTLRATKGPLPCKCFRRRNMALLRAPNCKRKHYGDNKEMAVVSEMRVS